MTPATAPVEPKRRFRYRDGLRASAPIAPLAFVFGISFGVLAKSSGMGSLAPVLMSAITFAGSAQFAAASVLATGGGALGAIGAAVLLNARYAPISLTVAPELRGGVLSRLAHSQLIVDESWAVSQVGGGRVDRRLLVGAGLALYVGWVGGTALGVLGAGLLGDPARYGLDAAFPALFLTLLVPQLAGRRAVIAAALGAAIAVALVPFSSPGVPIIAAAAASLVGLRR
jgi:4-azaleucine resistance transporter AzlC